MLLVIGSAVLEPATPETVTPPLTGTTKLTEQFMLPPTPNGLVADEQVIVALAGTPETAHVGVAARLGPLLVQVTVPLTVDPTGALAGNPDTIACISACGVTAMGLVSTLLLLTGSGVVEPAVVVMLSGPEAGALNVLVQVIDWPKGKLAGKGLGRHDCVVPAGKPLNAQVGDAAALGPALVQVPLTVTGCPAIALAGTLVVARISAAAVTATDLVSTLLAGTGS